MHKLLTAENIEEAVQWRRYLHSYPELAYEERATSQFIAGRLQQWGYQIRSGYGKTGLVATLTKGTSNRSIAIRADMDALPIVEETGVAHASKTQGVMHACGHDGHVATALAAAKVVGQLEFDGVLHFIFQPAEENEAGAKEMIKDGLFRDVIIDEIYGMHNWPALDVGKCVARDQEMMAALGLFEIIVKGRGAHGAMSHEGVDPVIAASQIVTALQTIVSRNISPLQSAVVSATQIHAGDAWNVIPETAVIRGTTRWFSSQAGEIIDKRIRDIAQSVAVAMGCQADIHHEVRYPATINTPACAQKIRKIAAASKSGLMIEECEPSMAAEDFAFMLQERPGCYFWLGAKKAGANPGLHSPHYDFNDALLPIGSTLWLEIIESLLPVR